MSAAIGIDVGGKGKGFHAVALVDGRSVEPFETCAVDRLVGWCRDHGAKFIAIDAPCRWSLTGRARPAERALMQRGVFCFSTPSRERAVAHPTGYFDWMLRGEALYAALAPTHPICDCWPMAPGSEFTFETFPHAITWQLSGGHCSARHKRTQRRALLAQAGIDTGPLTGIDLIDAALCALTAHQLASGGSIEALGEPGTGYTLIPALAQKDCRNLPPPR